MYRAHRLPLSANPASRRWRSNLASAWNAAHPRYIIAGMSKASSPPTPTRPYLLDYWFLLCGFALSLWCGDAGCEAKAKEELKVTIRCIPTGGTAGAPWEASLRDTGPCVLCGAPATGRVVFAKAY